jgi:hypothetical protein
MERSPTDAPLARNGSTTAAGRETPLPYVAAGHALLKSK